MFSIDLSPLKNYPNYRWLYLGQLISFFGSMITYVAIPFQMYELTKSSFHVGMLGIVQLIPLVFTGFWGGALADSVDRRKLAIITEVGSAFGNILLIIFSMTNSQNIYFLYTLSALMAALKGFERPSIEALTQQFINKKDIPKVSSLQSMKSTLGMILGPALGGVLIASVGITATYGVDFLTYVLSIICLMKIKDVPLIKEKKKATLSSIADGFRYSMKRADLMGSYLVDIASMVFAFPNPLFPALAAMTGEPGKLGWYYSATAIGAFLGSITSRWTHKVAAHGKMITWSAFFWCVGIIFFGMTSNFYLSLLFLAFAGFTDMLSGIFRSTLWNETIPEEYRGRLASVEMISYSAGPLLGNTFMGFMAEKHGYSYALISGGIIGCVVVLALGMGIRGFWNYRAVR